ncbi:hypothetical protein AB0E08_49810, partial [Streptomyces sp. NPDC048281]
GEYLLGGATSSSFPCSGQPYWMPVRKLSGPSHYGPVERGTGQRSDSPANAQVAPGLPRRVP